MSINTGLRAGAEAFVGTKPVQLTPPIRKPLKRLTIPVSFDTHRLKSPW
jgi:hypothetical protein